jgi:hypothetical protein
MHRWTSTWDLPSSIFTTGPQPGTFPAQYTPLDLNGQIKYEKHILNKIPNKISKKISENMPNKIPQYLPNKISKDFTR